MLRMLHLFWTSGSLRCVLVRLLQPSTLYIMVLSDHATLYSERIENPTAAADAADVLWTRFVENPA